MLVEAPAGPQGDGAQRVQVVAEPPLGAWWVGGRRGCCRLFGVQVEHRLLHDAVALGGVGAAPGRGQPAQLPRAHRGGGFTETLDELRAVSPFGARQRNEMPHRGIRAELSLAHQLLGLLWQFAHQSEPPGHPAYRVAHQQAQLLLEYTVTLDQLRQQPALLQRRALLSHLQPMCQAQRLHLGQRQHHRGHRVVPELLQGRDPLVAVDQHEAPRLIDLLDHHHRALLAVLAERRHELRSSLRVAGAGRPVGQVELVKLELAASLGLRCRAALFFGCASRHGTSGAQRQPSGDAVA